MLDERELPTEPIEVARRHGIGADRPLVHDLVEPSDAPATSSRAARRARRWTALRTFMFDHVYLGPAARREHAKIETVIRTLFDHYAALPDGPPTAAAPPAPTCRSA